MNSAKTFQQIIASLESFWASMGCVVLQSFDEQVGAGTLSPYTAMLAVTKEPISVCYPQLSTRPRDARFAQNPNRLGAYYQFQVLLKPAEAFKKHQFLYIESLKNIGLDAKLHDIRFVEDDWANDSIGASGLGYEVWCDGMEVTQFTYIQTMGGMTCDIVSCEITYGLERLAMYIQNKNSVFDIVWTYVNDVPILYGNIHTINEEIQRSQYFSKYNADTDEIKNRMEYIIANTLKMLEGEEKMPIIAYRQCLEASNLLNILDARSAISAENRTKNILAIRNLVAKCLQIHKEMVEKVM